MSPTSSKFWRNSEVYPGVTSPISGEEERMPFSPASQPFCCSSSDMIFAGERVSNPENTLRCLAMITTEQRRVRDSGEKGGCKPHTDVLAATI